jgi:uncharacterized protein YcfJ
MKKFLVVILMFVVLGFAVPSVSALQRRHHRRHSRTFWQRHRDKLTVAGTTATGAVVGSVIGGKKGALIGAGAGAGSGALYTYKIRKRHRHNRRYSVSNAR